MAVLSDDNISSFSLSVCETQLQITIKKFVNHFVCDQWSSTVPLLPSTECVHNAYVKTYTVCPKLRRILLVVAFFNCITCHKNKASILFVSIDKANIYATNTFIKVHKFSKVAHIKICVIAYTALCKFFLLLSCNLLVAKSQNYGKKKNESRR